MEAALQTSQPTITIIKVTIRLVPLNSSISSNSKCNRSREMAFTVYKLPRMVKVTSGMSPKDNFVPTALQPALRCPFSQVKNLRFAKSKRKTYFNKNHRVNGRDTNVSYAASSCISTAATSSPDIDILKQSHTTVFFNMISCKCS